MTGPPVTRRGPGDDGPDPGNTHKTDPRRPINHDRIAVDAEDQIAEAGRWIDAADLVMLAALDNRGYSPGEAIEYVLVCHGRVRTFLDLVLVKATS